MFGVIFTMPGMPMIYSGNEIGYDHNIAFMEKDPILWSSGTGDYSSLIRSLSELKKEHPALYAGRFGAGIEYLDFKDRNIFAYRRQLDGDSIGCVFNLSKGTRENIDWAGAGISSPADVLFTGSSVSPEGAAGSQTLTDSLDPWEYYIISEKR